MKLLRTFQFVDFLLQLGDVAFVLSSAILGLSQTEYTYRAYIPRAGLCP